MSHAGGKELEVSDIRTMTAEELNYTISPRFRGTSAHQWECVQELARRAALWERLDAEILVMGVLEVWLCESVPFRVNAKLRFETHTGSSTRAAVEAAIQEPQP